MTKKKSAVGPRKIISLFSGAMGLDLGLEKAGLEVAVAIERDANAVATIRRNRPDIAVIDRPIEDVTTDEILSAAGLKKGEAFAVVGGPSCQVFSTAGQRKSFDDPRGGMFRHFLRVVEEAQPKFFIMENVRGLISAAIEHRPLNEREPGYPALRKEEELGSAFRVVADSLRDLNYYSVFDVLNSADYGVPQTRQRLLILGSRDGKRLAMPEPTHSKDGSAGLPKWKTLKAAVNELGKHEPEYYDFCPTKRQFLAMVPEGKNWRSLPENFKEQALGKAYVSWGGRSGFFRRLSWGKPSPALTTRPDSKATMLCHPTELRPLSIQEYAAIQQFPHEWIFEGSVRQKYKQVGNAVPLGLGEEVGRALEAANRTHIKSERLGRVECFNLNLLASLCKRPKTIVNPPRMRKSIINESLSDWKGAKRRMRLDAFDYVSEDDRPRLSEMTKISLDVVQLSKAEEFREFAVQMVAE